MIKILDGPAEGQTFGLRDAPLFLRVVNVAPGQWDALDQPTDRCEPREIPIAYMRIGETHRIHAQMAGPRGRGRRCAWFSTGEYRIVPDGPAEAVMRDNDRWFTWCRTRIGGPAAE